jgi:hypothetical protein
MADYRELLRRAISALPENNGAARRAVYEKARTALVGQLRAITPPLPARDITQHRLQLEDCIRQVEHEASEAVISLGREGGPPLRPAASGTFTPRQPVAPVRTSPPPEPSFVAPEDPQPTAPPSERDTRATQDTSPDFEEPMLRPPGRSIEEIIAEAAAATGAEVTPSDASPADMPVETASVIAIPSREPEPVEPAPRPSFFAPRRDAVPAAISTAAAFTAQPASIDRLEPSLGSTALARQPATEPVVISPPLPVEPALNFGQVEADTEADEAQGAIERAIETLDREARGETTPLAAGSETAENLASTGEPAGRNSDTAFAAADAETRSGAGLTIFLVVFALLLVGVGGAGYWAWREGYVDLDQMFGGQTSTVEQAQSNEPSVPTMDSPSADLAAGEDGAAGPGNTATNQASEPSSALGLEAEDRLTPEPVTPTGTEATLPSIANGEIKTEERLSGSDTTIAATDDPAASVDPANLAGNQSLLLEASADGRSGAVPFSGTVEWSEGTDEIGGPTLIGRASIPARNLGVSLTIRRNNDPVLPASHLMEISFDVPDTFIGGSVATLAGVLLKDQELVPGTALTGAAARVVGNSFLFALSANEADVAANTRLLDQRRWIDLAVVYGTGRNAILTLEKDEEAQVLFDRVLAAWAE